MTTDYPVQLDVASPARFQRVQLVVRLLLSIVLGWLGITAGWLVCMLYGVLPLVAAIAISSIGVVRYRDELAPRMWKALAWLLEVWAFMALLVDVLPGASPKPVHTSMRFTGTPTVGSALLRLLTSIPSGFVLFLLWCVSAFLTFISALIVLFGAEMPSSILGFQRGVLRWNARLVAYHASLVEEYPPFALDTADSTPLGASGWGGQEARRDELRT